MKLDLIIVDDSRLWLSLGEKLANDHPLIGRVQTFDDSMDAWVHLQVQRPDAVLTDIEMPGMNGLSFIEMFGAKIPFISSSTKTGYALLAKELGCHGFLSKPFSKNDFGKAIESLHSELCSDYSAS